MLVVLVKIFLICFRTFNGNDGIAEITSYDSIEDVDHADNGNEEIVKNIEIFDILDNITIDNIDGLILPPHQRCAAHTLNLIATVDIFAAENDGTYKRISRRVFGKCQSLFNKQNQSTQSADQVKDILGRYLLQMSLGIYIL